MISHLNKVFLSLLFIMNLSIINATDQIVDVVLYEGKEFYVQNFLYSPIEEHPKYEEIRETIFSISVEKMTACRRGYFCIWELKKNGLFYLKDILYCLNDEEIDLTKFWGSDDKEGVLADWYSGNLECRLYEEDYFFIHDFKIKSGKLKWKRFYDNTKTNYSDYSTFFDNLVYENANWGQLPKIPEDESISISILVKTDETGRIIRYKIKEKQEGLQEWENEILEILQVIPEWNIIYEKGKRKKIVEGNIYIRSKQYYDNFYEQIKKSEERRKQNRSY